MDSSSKTAATIRFFSAVRVDDSESDSDDDFDEPAQQVVKARSKENLAAENFPNTRNCNRFSGAHSDKSVKKGGRINPFGADNSSSSNNCFIDNSGDISSDKLDSSTNPFLSIASNDNSSIASTQCFETVNGDGILSQPGDRSVNNDISSIASTQCFETVNGDGTSSQPGDGSPSISDLEDSICDILDDQGLPGLARHSRQRTDSDSNLLLEDSDASDDQLIININDDHFGLPEDLSRIRDVNLEIDRLKKQVLTTPDESKEKGDIIEKLISLRLRRDELQDSSIKPETEEIKSIYGHDFLLKYSADGAKSCEVCCALIWGLVQTWYTCLLCHISCHEKCLNALKRMCSSVKVKESPVFSLIICPDVGLMSQNYRCYECKDAISYRTGMVEPRQCDYTGHYYCHACHWDDEMIIPARVVHNWDFEPRQVSRAAKQYLKLLYSKPTISIKKSNPKLFNFVDELKEMQRLREELLMMKTYFLSCQFALQSKLLLKLSDRQHFVENVDAYSLLDLVELVNERLLPKIVNIHASFASHIKIDCDICKGKGFFCELCGKSEVLFPFDNMCVSCKECGNVFHKYCYVKTNTCPRCARRQRRQEENTRKATLLKQIEMTYSN